MSEGRARSSVEIAATRLRELALSVDSGTLLGSEEALIEKVGSSRPTVRQAARMLEREGLLKVRRGIGGGYLAARPDMSAIEQIVSVYMEMRAVEPEEMTTVTSVLWIEAVRRAAAISDHHPKHAMAPFVDRIDSLPLNASFDDILAIEDDVRHAVFALVGTHYIELIFQISLTFARRTLAQSSQPISVGPGFVADWKAAKTLEVTAIGNADPVVAVIGADRVRALIRRCVLGDVTN